MGLPKNLTERQQKFAELLVYNEGRKSPSECAYEAGYKTRPRQTASELRNPKIAPLVVQYIGELRAEIQEKYGINFEKHIGELAKLREDARAKGAWSVSLTSTILRIDCKSAVDLLFAGRDRAVISKRITARAWAAIFTALPISI